MKLGAGWVVLKNTATVITTAGVGTAASLFTTSNYKSTSRATTWAPASGQIVDFGAFMEPTPEPELNFAGGHYLYLSMGAVLFILAQSF